MAIAAIPTTPQIGYMFRRLDPTQIVETARQVRQRVTERFPNAGLQRVAVEVVEVTESAAATRAWFASPHWPLRIAVGFCILLLVLVFVATLLAVAQLPATSSIPEVVQTVDSFISEVVFLGVAIVFLSSLEIRRKRRRALRAIHELRSIAHVIDMHQLTKDPERVVNSHLGDNTASSPVRTMTAFELSRYLDYCSEMLSLLSKCAAVYAQDFDDPITISAVNEIESLTSGLSRKIWQKILVLGSQIPGSERVAT